jgi:hypothetical protein
MGRLWALAYRAVFGDGQGRAELLELLTRVTSIRDRALLDWSAWCRPGWIRSHGWLLHALPMRLLIASRTRPTLAF